MYMYFFDSYSFSFVRFVNIRYYNSFITMYCSYWNYSIYLTKILYCFEQKALYLGNIVRDLWWRVVYLYTDGFSFIDIANTLYISKSSVIRIIKIYEKWACITNPFKGIPGRRKLFSRGNMYILQSLIRDKVNWYLDELVCDLEIT